MNFHDFELNDAIMRAIDKLGFETPTPIQEKVIPHLLAEKSDVVGLAQTGTGKTAAFGLPIIEKIEKKERYIQSLILCPTRELCLQITGDMENFARFTPNISITAVYGGAAIVPQIKDIKRGTHVVVATPGRLLDLINRGVADLSAIKYLVLDEADIMLNMGFKDEIDAILEAAPAERQTILLSATMPREVAKIASTYMKNPVEITIGEKNAGVSTVEHKYFMVHSRDKYLALKRIVDFHPEIYGIIFCRTRRSTQEIADKMIKDGYNAESLHGDLSQAQREIVMKKFREKNLQLLVATDIAARGLDVNDLTHIIHYDLPDEIEVYNHRSGRTGRAGKKGTSFSVINMKEKSKLKRIENVIKRKITPEKVPTGKDICEHQLMHLIDRVKAVEVKTEQIAPYLSVIEEKLAALSREDLLKHFVSLEFNRFLNYYKNTPDISIVSGERKHRDDSVRGPYKRSGGGAGFTWLSVNLGKKDNVLPPQLIGLINQCTRNRNIKLGRIDISFNKSSIQVESAYADVVYNSLNGYNYRGSKIQADRVSGSSQGGNYGKGSYRRGDFQKGDYRNKRGKR
ncbi:MAG: DEAD/DEAH box helicase [Spirochaetales bacterium]|nr:DEAD/DEAH box helicase [Spirochaetales bacterium]